MQARRDDRTARLRPHLPERMVLQKGNAAFFLKTIWERRARNGRAGFPWNRPVRFEPSQSVASTVFIRDARGG